MEAEGKDSADSVRQAGTGVSVHTEVGVEAEVSKWRAGSCVIWFRGTKNWELRAFSFGRQFQKSRIAAEDRTSVLFYSKTGWTLRLK